MDINDSYKELGKASQSIKKKRVELSPDNVGFIFFECLFKDGEDTKNHVAVKGIVHNFGFHPERLKLYENDIYEMLLQLPENFQKEKGGGWSFLEACNNKDGMQWTGMHQTMEQLFCLGMSIGKVKCQVSKETWMMLPGEMPYYVIN